MRVLAAVVQCSDCIAGELQHCHAFAGVTGSKAAVIADFISTVGDVVSRSVRRLGSGPHTTPAKFANEGCWLQVIEDQCEGVGWCEDRCHFESFRRNTPTVVVTVVVAKPNQVQVPEGAPASYYDMSRGARRSFSPPAGRRWPRATAGFMETGRMSGGSSGRRYQGFGNLNLPQTPS
jgi:hypothetical protein